jgi:hypothetical protein
MKNKVKEYYSDKIGEEQNEEAFAVVGTSP